METAAPSPAPIRPLPPLPPLERRRDQDIRNLLARAHGRAQQRQYSGEPLTGFGDFT